MSADKKTNFFNQFSEGSDSKLVRFLQKWGRRLIPEGDRSAPTARPPAQHGSPYLYLLKALPVLCLIGWLFSFWRLEGGITLSWYQESVAISELFRTVAMTGLIGFLTNWLAIKMLFYPRRRRPILGQGLIPARKNQIAERLGEQLSNEIINSQLIVEQIQKSGLVGRYHKQFADSLNRVVREPEFRQDLIETAQHYIDNFVNSPHFLASIQSVLQTVEFERTGLLEGAVLKAYKAVNRVIKGSQGTATEIQEMIKDLVLRMDRHEDRLARFLDRLPDIVWRKRESIEKGVLSATVFLLEQVNVQNVIMENIKSFDEIRLEKLFRQSTSDQLDYIQYLGCLLGIIGGVVIWFPYESLLLGLSLGGLLWALDAAILRWRTDRKKP